MFLTRNHVKNFMPKRDIDILKTSFNNDELEALAGLSTPVEVPAGTALMVEGTLGRQALVMVDGTASVIRNGRTIATIAAGELIGEIALLTGERRNATVVVDTDATVYALSAREFSSLLARCPRILKRIATTAVHRLAVA